MNIQEQRKARNIEAIRKVARDITIEDVTVGKMVKRERGHLTGTIAGQKVHNLTYQIRYWDDGTHDLYCQPDCGTIRAARGTGGHYVNYYSNLGREVTCSKCLKR